MDIYTPMCYLIHNWSESAVPVTGLVPDSWPWQISLSPSSARAPLKFTGEICIPLYYLHYFEKSCDTLER